MAKCFKGSFDYSFKRRTFDGQRSGNRRFWKRYARRMARRGMSNSRGTGYRDGWLRFLINNP